MTTTEVIVLCLAIMMAVFVAWMVIERRRTARLRERFGPEFERVAGTEGMRRASAILEAREKRMAHLNIRPLGRTESIRYIEEWRLVQGRFVDDPLGATAQADRLVEEALRARGFPMSDFVQQAADLSVDHPDLVENYRVAHDIAQMAQRGQASTEELRRAMQHYRAVMEGITEKEVHEPIPTR